MKKPCVTCGKQIPSVAYNCVFCSARQPAPDFSDIDVLKDAVERARSKTAEHASISASGSASGGLFDDDPGSQTEHTLVGLRIADLSGGDVAESPIKEKPVKEANGSSQLKHTAIVPVVTPPPEVAKPAEPVKSQQAPQPEAAPEAQPFARPWQALGRAVMGVGGGFMILLFLLPWHGASSWQLLETLAGADFVRQLFYLAGGIVLLATAILPLPFAFRAAVGAGVAALPVLLGAHGVLDGWAAVFAALAIVGLPALHLARTPEERKPVMAAVAAIALLAVPIGVAVHGMRLSDGTQLYVAISLLGASAIAAVSTAQLLSLRAQA